MRFFYLLPILFGCLACASYQEKNAATPNSEGWNSQPIPEVAAGDKPRKEEEKTLDTLGVEIEMVAERPPLRNTLPGEAAPFDEKSWQERQTLQYDIDQTINQIDAMIVKMEDRNLSQATIDEMFALREDVVGLQEEVKKSTQQSWSDDHQKIRSQLKEYNTKAEEISMRNKLP